MTLQEKIATILDTPVFGGKLYYIQAPDQDGSASKLAETFGVFSIVGGQSFQSLEGDTDLSRPRVQISIFAISPLTLIDKVAAVNAAMKAACNRCDTVPDPDADALALYNYSSSVPVDGFEPETRRYYSHMDFYCWSRS